mmetsp:Transcript_62550/g.153724  ORF Transcript_62550/g.153724 Transcript_62550/m.153724 type:complete len:233 (+) Transcript_62550:407-1105(+)
MRRSSLAEPSPQEAAAGCASPHADMSQGFSCRPHRSGGTPPRPCSEATGAGTRQPKELFPHQAESLSAVKKPAPTATLGPADLALRPPRFGVAAARAPTWQSPLCPLGRCVHGLQASSCTPRRHPQEGTPATAAQRPSSRGCQACSGTLRRNRAGTARAAGRTPSAARWPMPSSSRPPRRARPPSSARGPAPPHLLHYLLRRGHGRRSRIRAAPRRRGCSCATPKSRSQGSR